MRDWFDSLQARERLFVMTAALFLAEAPPLKPNVRRFVLVHGHTDQTRLRNADRK